MPPPVTEAALRTIYRETIDSLYGYASRKCGGQRELAEDVTQEVWLRAVREWPRIGIPEKPLAWLITVARNLIVNHFNKGFNRGETVPLDAVSASDALTALDDNAANDSVEIAQVVTRALAMLPPEESQLLEAFHFERRKMSELATTLDVSERAIEGRLRRARERLRKILTESSTAEGIGT